MNKLFKALIYDKQVSLSVLDTTDLVNKAIKIHNLSGQSARLLGNLLTVCAYMSGCLKSDKGAVSITVKSPDSSGSLAGGTVTVIKDDGFYRPFVGTCLAGSDDVSAIITEYFHMSEQIPTAVSVDVKLGEDGSCIAAGGVIMQLLPGTSEVNIAKAEERMQAFLKPADVIAECGAEGIIRTYFDGQIDKNGLYLLHPDYICNCSRSKIEAVILPLGEKELLSVCDEQGCVSVHCHYCNTDYTFDKDDIKKLFAK